MSPCCNLSILMVPIFLRRQQCLRMIILLRKFWTIEIKNVGKVLGENASSNGKAWVFEHNSWEAASHCSNCTELVGEYWQDRTRTHKTAVVTSVAIQ